MEHAMIGIPDLLLDLVSRPPVRISLQLKGRIFSIINNY